MGSQDWGTTERLSLTKQHQIGLERSPTPQAPPKGGLVIRLSPNLYSPSSGWNTYEETGTRTTITIISLRERGTGQARSPGDAIFPRPLYAGQGTPVPTADQETPDPSWPSYCYSWEPGIKMNKYQVH